MSSIPIEVPVYDGDNSKIIGVPDGNTPLLTMNLKDTDGSAVTAGNVNTATMSLVLNDTGTVINDREAVDVKNKIDENGLFKMLLEEADCQFYSDDRLDEELHVARIRITADGVEGPIVIDRTFRFKIINQKHVPNPS